MSQAIFFSNLYVALISSKNVCHPCSKLCFLADRKSDNMTNVTLVEFRNWCLSSTLMQFRTLGQQIEFDTKLFGEVLRGKFEVFWIIFDGCPRHQIFFWQGNNILFGLQSLTFILNGCKINFNEMIFKLRFSTGWPTANKPTDWLIQYFSIEMLGGDI